MNCRMFRRDLSDWLRGEETISSEQMQAHSTSCRECAREEALERHLRGAWRTLPEPNRTPEVWPRVAAVINGPAPQIQWKPARFALGSAFALGALAALFYANSPARLTTQPSGGKPTVAQVDERRVVEMVQELRQIPDIDSDRLAMEPPHRVHAAMFLGDGERK